MSESKFKVWDIKREIMSEVAAIHFNICEPYDVKQVCIMFDRLWLGKGEFILRKFTGLKDKNGKEIYEGDILKVYHFRDYTGCDQFMYKEIAWHTTLATWYFKSKGKLHNSLWVLLKNSDCEVIGNIHENSELLEVLK